MKRQNLRTVSLIVVTFTYLLIGAAIFGYLESEHEVRQREYLELIELIIKRKYNISDEDYTVLTTTVIKSVPHKAGIQWKFPGAFYFATTVVTTIGYGHSTPATMAGRSFCMIYALIGIPLGLVMFQSIGERLNTIVGCALCYSKRCFKAKNPEVTQTNLVMVVLVLSTILMTSMAAVFAKYERWDYFDALYYCFITLTTIGFGDYVALQKESALQSKPEYVALSLIFILFGLSVVSSAVNLLVLKFLTLNTEDERRDEQLRYTANLNPILLEGDVITSSALAAANQQNQHRKHQLSDHHPHHHEENEPPPSPATSPQTNGRHQIAIYRPTGTPSTNNNNSNTNTNTSNTIVRRRFGQQTNKQEATPSKNNNSNHHHYHCHHDNNNNNNLWPTKSIPNLSSTLSHSSQLSASSSRAQLAGDSCHSPPTGAIEQLLPLMLLKNNNNRNHFNNNNNHSISSINNTDFTHPSHSITTERLVNLNSPYPPTQAPTLAEKQQQHHHRHRHHQHYHHQHHYNQSTRHKSQQHRLQLEQQQQQQLGSGYSHCCPPDQQQGQQQRQRTRYEGDDDVDEKQKKNQSRYRLDYESSSLYQVCLQDEQEQRDDNKNDQDDEDDEDYDEDDDNDEDDQSIRGEEERYEQELAECNHQQQQQQHHHHHQHENHAANDEQADTTATGAIEHDQQCLHLHQHMSHTRSSRHLPPAHLSDSSSRRRQLYQQLASSSSSHHQHHHHHHPNPCHHGRHQRHQHHRQQPTRSDIATAEVKTSERWLQEPPPTARAYYCDSSNSSSDRAWRWPGADLAAAGATGSSHENMNSSTVVNASDIAVATASAAANTSVNAQPTTTTAAAANTSSCSCSWISVVSSSLDTNAQDNQQQHYGEGPPLAMTSSSLPSTTSCRQCTGVHNNQQYTSPMQSYQHELLQDQVQSGTTTTKRRRSSGQTNCSAASSSTATSLVRQRLRHQQQQQQQRFRANRQDEFPASTSVGHHHQQQHSYDARHAHQMHVAPEIFTARSRQYDDQTCIPSMRELGTLDVELLLEQQHQQQEQQRRANRATSIGYRLTGSKSSGSLAEQPLKRDDGPSMVSCSKKSNSQTQQKKQQQHLQKQQQLNKGQDNAVAKLVCKCCCEHLECIEHALASSSHISDVMDDRKQQPRTSQEKLNNDDIDETDKLEKKDNSGTTAGGIGTSNAVAGSDERSAAPLCIPSLSLPKQHQLTSRSAEPPPSPLEAAVGIVSSESCCSVSHVASEKRPSDLGVNRQDPSYSYTTSSAICSTNGATRQVMVQQALVERVINDNKVESMEGGGGKQEQKEEEGLISSAELTSGFPSSSIPSSESRADKSSQQQQ